VLARIIDAAMLGAIERYVKQAIVDKYPLVASSALVSSFHLFESSNECAAIVRRWLNEVQQALQSPSAMVQFHALSLLYQIKQHDRLAISKLVTQLSKNGSLRSPMAIVLLVRYTSKLLHDEAADDNDSELARQSYQFLESSLRHKSEVVVFEACKAICGLPGVEPQDLSPAISVLQHLLSSHKPVVRFAAMRCISKVALTMPMAVVKCNEDMEVLISDSNRSIATLAITTLLKTGTENSVDRLMKSIGTFMSDIADEYKIVVVSSIKELCMKYPGKHRVLIGFLSNFLREEGGFEFKKTIVEAIIFLMDNVTETRDNSLLQLCEFIEDCEFTALSTNILHLVGNVGPECSAPARYIRYCYNRVILETAAVRAAAVSALAKFGAKVPSLRQSILTLLKRSLSDEDDEVRDRATIACNVIERAIEENPYVKENDANADANADTDADAVSPSDTATYLLLQPLPMNFSQLERSLKQYMSAPGAMTSDEPVTFSTLPVVEEEDPAEEAGASASSPRNKNKNKNNTDILTESTSSTHAAEEKAKNDPTEAIYAIPELAALGRVFRSSKPVELSESETEYVVRCTKHIMDSHVVLAFNVQNTLDDQKLVDVKVAIEGEAGDEFLTPTGELEAPEIKYGGRGVCYTVLDRDMEAPLASCTFACELAFTVVSVDPNSGEETGDTFEETYPLENLDFTTADFIAKVNLGDFRSSWDTLGNGNEVLQKFSLQFKKLSDAVEAVINFFGMMACDGTGIVKANRERGKPHMLHLSGRFVGNVPVMVRAQIGQGGEGIVLKVAVRSEDASVSQQVADCIS